MQDRYLMLNCLFKLTCFLSLMTPIQKQIGHKFIIILPDLVSNDTLKNVVFYVVNTTICSQKYIFSRMS